MSQAGAGSQTGAGSQAGAVERLRGLDSCAVSDALDRHGVRGVVTGPRPLAAAGTIAGRAVTVLLGPPGGSAQAPARHLCSAAVDASGPGEVIVVAHQGRTDCAGWGGLLSRAAAIRGIADEVLATAERIAATEAAMAAAIDAGTPVSDVMGGSYEELTDVQH